MQQGVAKAHANPRDSRRRAPYRWQMNVLAAKLARTLRSGKVQFTPEPSATSAISGRNFASVTFMLCTAQLPARSALSPGFKTFTLAPEAEALGHWPLGAKSTPGGTATERPTRRSMAPVRLCTLRHSP